MDIDWSKYLLATHYTPGRDSHFAGFWQMSGEKAIKLWRLELKDGTEAVQYDNPTVFYLDLKDMIPRPVEWSGAGLPPIGTKCIVTPHNTLWGFQSVEDYECKVLAYNDYYVWLDNDCYQFITTRTDKVDFRPIRTKEQIAAEARSKAIDAMCEHGVDAGDETIRITCAALYDAGYAPKVTP